MMVVSFHLLSAILVNEKKVFIANQNPTLPSSHPTGLSRNLPFRAKMELKLILFETSQADATRAWDVANTSGENENSHLDQI
jgi:hypothetical protein